MSLCVVLCLLLLAAPVALAQELRPATPDAAAPVNGFPNWEERVLHQWINRARVAPSADLAGCGANCSPDEMAPTCYVPVPPLMWKHETAVAARFHSASMARQGFFAHATPCTLRSNLADLYPTSCDGSEGCSCSSPDGSTSAGARVGLFGSSYSGEIIAAGYTNPVSAFYGWLHEPASTAPCGFTMANGHRWLILKASNSLGSGYATGGAWGHYYTTDFGSGGATSRIPSGAHYPRQASSIDFWANWYDSQPPSAARLIVGSTTYPMILGRGTTTNGAWTTTVNGLGSGCHRYYFEFLDSGGAPVRHPESGTFGIGPLASCADWVGTEIPAPTITATALTTASVQVSWTSSPGATQYELQRSVDHVPFAPLITLSTTAYSDFAVVAGKTYLYRIRPVGGSTWSNTDHATTMGFTEDPLIAQTTVLRSVHLTELRSAVNMARQAAGLGGYPWTDPSPAGMPAKAAHVLELRTALLEALAGWGKSATFTYNVTPGAPPRTTDFQELRNALK